MDAQSQMNDQILFALSVIATLRMEYFLNKNKSLVPGCSDSLSARSLASQLISVIGCQCSIEISRIIGCGNCLKWIVQRK